MRDSRAVVLVLYVGELALGAFLTYLAVMSVLDNFAHDFPSVAAHRIATALAFFLVTVGFGGVLVLRGFTPLAPFLFAASFVAVGFIVHVNTLMMSKNFAPFEPTPFSYVTSVAEILMVSVAALLALFWTWRGSRYPLW